MHLVPRWQHYFWRGWDQRVGLQWWVVPLQQCKWVHACTHTHKGCQALGSPSTLPL